MRILVSLLAHFGLAGLRHPGFLEIRTPIYFRSPENHKLLQVRFDYVTFFEIHGRIHSPETLAYCRVLVLVQFLLFYCTNGDLQFDIFLV